MGFWFPVPFLQRHAPSLSECCPAEPSNCPAPQGIRLRPFHQVRAVECKPRSLLCHTVGNPASGQGVRNLVIDFVHSSGPALYEPLSIVQGHLWMSHLDSLCRTGSCPSLPSRCIRKRSRQTFSQIHDRSCPPACKVYASVRTRAKCSCHGLAALPALDDLHLVRAVAVYPRGCHDEVRPFGAYGVVLYFLRHLSGISAAGRRPGGDRGVSPLVAEKKRAITKIRRGFSPECSFVH